MHVSLDDAGGATTDHTEIRRWIEERGGKPAISPDGKLGIKFSDTRESDVAWSTFFEIFENNSQVFVYQGKLSDGSVSSFFKFTDR